MWTFPHTDGSDRARPSDFSRPQFASAVVEAYEHLGKSIGQWSVFLEVHPLSKSKLEKTDHFHMVVETQGRCRWSEVAQHLRRAHKIHASVSTSSQRQSYWTAFAYLYAPSGKKTKDDIDAEFLLSPGHEEPPQKLQQRRQGVRRIDPAELYECIAKNNLKTVLSFFAFAARQHAAGDRSWLSYCMKMGEAKVNQVALIAAAAAPPHPFGDQKTGCTFEGFDFHMFVSGFCL